MTSPLPQQHPTSTVGSWGISTPLPLPIGWDASEANVLWYFPEFLRGIKLQLSTVVAFWMMRPSLEAYLTPSHFPTPTGVS